MEWAFQLLNYENEYGKLKSAEKINPLKHSCKIYKINMNKAYRDYEYELFKKIRKLQFENTRE